jgi:hypothetical protein
VKSLKYLCLFLSLVSIVAALTGIQAIATGSSGTTIWHYNVYGRVFAFGVALVFAAFAYGIHIRARIFWKLGFVLLALSYIYFVVGGMTTLYRFKPVPSLLSFCLLAGLLIIVGAAVATYWGRWWSGQRNYFLSEADM